jgi:hypothetical protein
VLFRSLEQIAEVDDKSGLYELRDTPQARRLNASLCTYFADRQDDEINTLG